MLCSYIRYDWRNTNDLVIIRKINYKLKKLNDFKFTRIYKIEMKMNVGRPFIQLTDENIETMKLQDAAGIYQRKDIPKIQFVYRLLDLYMVGWLYNNTFYCDKNEIDKNGNVSNPTIGAALSIAGIVKIKSVRFDFNYNSLPVEKMIETQWEVVSKLLKGKKTDIEKRMRGVVSVAILTSESWRFYPIENACRRNPCCLNLGDSVWNYIDAPSDAVKSFNYTLLQLIRDWKKLRLGEPIYIHGEKIPFTEEDMRQILK